jgi:hypothetical protein
MGAVKSFRWLAVTLFFSTLCFADSQVRIVRLSSVDGDVQVDRNTGQFEKAFLNLPLTQGVRLQTGNDSRTEVEFEDGSVVRLAPRSLVEFASLSLRDSGAKVSEIKVQQGTAYIDFRGTKEDEFTVDFGHESVSLKDAAHFRVQMGDTTSTLAVMKGKIKVDGTSGSVDVGKNDAATFDLANKDQYEMARLDDAPFDAWDKEQGKYHDAYTSRKQNGYGTSDLNYYGNYINAPGYGMVWQPYFVGAGWDPFMDGAWAYYPGSGYTWVSAYPWGWTPYHCGSWLFMQSFGWGWQPGGCGSFFGFPTLINAPVGYQRPIPPTGVPGRTTIVMTPKPISHPIVPMNRAVIENNSAGLGIPRGSIRDMSRLSTTVRERGSAVVSYRPTPITNPRPVFSNPGMSRSNASSGAASASSVSRATPSRSTSSPSMSAPRSSSSAAPIPRSSSPRR